MWEHVMLFSLIISKLKCENTDSLDNRFIKILNVPENNAQIENVNPETELEVFKKINQINPEVLQLLLPNITEEPDSFQESSHCCYNGGTCNVPSPDLSQRWCHCPANFTGRYCDLDVDECKIRDACNDDQRCENIYGSYICHCEDGFIEVYSRCIRKTNCEDDPCLNFGDCVDLDEGQIQCICRIGYSGERCEKKIPECGDSACSEGDICIATPVGYECVKIS